MRTRVLPRYPISHHLSTHSHLFPSLSSLELVLLHGESHIQKLLLLSEMDGLQTRGDRRAGAATSIHDVLAVVVLGVVEKSLDTGLGVAPSSGVQGLLLGPDNGLGVGVLVEVVAELLPWEGVELLNTGDGDVVKLVLGAVLMQRGINLARAENDAFNLLRSLDFTRLVSRVGDDPSELGVAGEFFNVRASKGVTEKGLGEEDDKGWVKSVPVISK